MLSYVAEALSLRNSQKGIFVRRFEEAFAKYVGAKYAIAHANGTCTMHTALVALGVQSGDRVAVPPLTYGSTTLAVLHAGAKPVFLDVSPDTWIMRLNDWFIDNQVIAIPVSLYGLHSGWSAGAIVDDAAETLNQHEPRRDGLHPVPFTSYSFEASKILAIGEGGMLVTNDSKLAETARSFSIVGATFEKQPRSPAQIRHVRVGWNYQMSDVQAAVGLARLEHADELIAERQYSAQCYRQALADCDWIVPQYVPEGWAYTPWCFGMAVQHRDQWQPLADAIVKSGGERPYAAFRLTYQEPAFRHLASDGTCPVAEHLQPRLMQLQTNHHQAGAEYAAECLRDAISRVN